MAIHLIYFSPGGTTKATVRKIAEGIGGEVIEHDMLKKENRKQQLYFTKDDLVIVGMMTCVKMFGFPEEIFPYLNGDNTPFVGVVMYGNGFYGSSLRQMKKVVEKRGFNMVAGGAFIGQNSADPDLATGRPDASDQKIQLDFGKKISRKLLEHGDHSFSAKIPFDWPKDKFSIIKSAIMQPFASWGMIKLFSPMNKLAVSNACTHCGKCEANCPTGAMDSTTNISDPQKCIGCFACINGCPQKAIAYTHPALCWAVRHCSAVWQTRREPEIFI